jgi:protocatechuate 3,4-dioxygenase beta subunit
VAVIRGRVVDPQGQPVAQAAVYIVSSPASMPDIAQLTDEQGQFAMSAPVPGSYTVGARSDDWGIAKTDVAVGSEEEVTVEVKFEKP